MAGYDDVPSDEELDEIIEHAAPTRLGSTSRIERLDRVVARARQALKQQGVRVEDLARRQARNPMSDDNANAKPPRIVCTTCPAVAVVHYWKPVEPNGNFGEIWVECHDEHVFGHLNLQQSIPGVGKSDLLLQHITRFADPTIENHFAHAERQMQEYAEKARIYQAFLQRRPPR